MKTNNRISAYVLRCSMAALLFSCMLVAICSAINLSEQPPRVFHPQDNAAFGAKGQESRSLSFADRVTYQRAIEEVYWRHRIWPQERPDPKPSLDAVMSQAAFEKKVRNTCVIRSFNKSSFSTSTLHADGKDTRSGWRDNSWRRSRQPAELYNVDTGTWSATGQSRHCSRVSFTRNQCCADGRVLVAGGNDTASRSRSTTSRRHLDSYARPEHRNNETFESNNRSKCGEETYPGDLFAHPDL